MTLPQLEPLDIVVVDGQWFMPHHWLIRWRGLDPGVHCFTVAGALGEGWSPEFMGIKRRHLSHYRGRRITVHRLKNNAHATEILQRLVAAEKTATGYDFRQWLLGFILGMTRRAWVDSSTQWTCAEFPYWPIQDRLRITPTDEVLPMPRLFRYNPAFETVFSGVCP